MTDLTAAVAMVQAELPKIGRTTKGQVGTRNYKYADYETIMAKVRPLLEANGLVWSCQPTMIEGLLALRWRLMLKGTQDEWTGLYPIATGSPQAQGSAITYAKRYAIVAVLDIPVAGEDDDGHAAGQDAPTVTSRTRAKVPGPEHERLREGTAVGRVDGTERRRGPDPDDPWAVDEGQEAEREGGTLSDKQRSRIMRHLGRMARDARADRLTNLVGREIDSTNDLSYAEAAEVIKVLEA